MLSIEKKMTKDEVYYMREIKGSILADLSLTQLLDNQRKMLHLDLNQKSKKFSTRKNNLKIISLNILLTLKYYTWEIDGETVETVSDFILGGDSKIPADGD